MTMTDVETMVRQSLLQWADDVRPTPPRPGAVRRRVAVRRRHRITRAAGVVAVVGAGAAVVGGVLRSEGTTTTVRTADAPPDDAAAGGSSDPPLFVLDPPWAVTFGVMGIDGDGVPPTYSNDLVFQNGDLTVEVVSYTLGSRSTAGGSTVVVRGVEGQVSEAGVGQVRIGWDEGGVTMEATGTGFADATALADVLAGLRFVDEADFVATLPDGVGDGLLVGIRSYPLDGGGYVVWTPDGGIECGGDEEGPPAQPFDPVTGCFP